MTMKCKKNYYDILGVTPDSDSTEVKTSYRHLARMYHPDVNKSPESVQKFKDVLEAYETLSDEVKRKQYDMINGFYKTPKKDFGKKYERQDKKADTKPEFKETGNSKTDSYVEKETTNKTSQEKKQDIYESYTKKFFKDKVSSILDEISKKHAEKAVKRQPKDGDDVYTEVSITLTEAVRGCERVLNIMHKELCPHCNGRKFINSAKCPKCGGSGIYQTNRKLTVKIPKGVRNDSKLRLAGEGNPGFFGGSNGNLYITIKVEKDEHMQLEGNNVIYKLPISPFEAVLGSVVEVPSFDGNINLTIPPMTSSGQEFRIANKGLMTNGKIGDMIISVEIQLPKELSEDEVTMYSKLKRMSQTSVRDY